MKKTYRIIAGSFRHPDGSLSLETDTIELDDEAAARFAGQIERIAPAPEPAPAPAAEPGEPHGS